MKLTIRKENALAGPMEVAIAIYLLRSALLLYYSIWVATVHHYNVFPFLEVT